MNYSVLLEKAEFYLSLDWLKISDFLLTECGYDGWGWEFLFHAIQRDDEASVIAFLYRKFNQKFNVPDPTVIIDNIHPMYDLLLNLRFTDEFEAEGIESLYHFTTSQQIVTFFGDIDILRMAEHFSRGLCFPDYKLSHRMLLRRKIQNRESQWIYDCLPRKINRYTREIRIDTIGASVQLKAAIGTVFGNRLTHVAADLSRDVYEIQAKWDECYTYSPHIFKDDKKPFHQRINDKHQKKNRRK